MDFLLSQGRCNLPPHQNLTAKFVSHFFLVQKKLLKTHEVNSLARIWRFKNCTVESIGQIFPQKDTAVFYFLENTQIAKLDKTYFLTVS